MIDVKDLKRSDIGRPVTYLTNHGTKHFGVLSSYDADSGRMWVKFNGPNGELTNADQCRWGWDAVSQMKGVPHST